MDAVYGIRIDSEDGEKYLSMAKESADVFAEIAIPGRYIVELLPRLAALPAWLPGMGFKRQAALWKGEVNIIRDAPYEAARRSMVGRLF